VADVLQALDIQVYSGYILAECNEGRDDVTEITSASFTSTDEPLTIECVVSVHRVCCKCNVHYFIVSNCKHLLYSRSSGLL